MQVEVTIVFDVKEGETTSSTRTRLRDILKAYRFVFPAFEVKDAKQLYPSRQYEAYGKCETCGAEPGQPCIYKQAGFTSATGVWREHQPGEPTIQVHHGRPAFPHREGVPERMRSQCDPDPREWL